MHGVPGGSGMTVCRAAQTCWGARRQFSSWTPPRPLLAPVSGRRPGRAPRPSSTSPQLSTSSQLSTSPQIPACPESSASESESESESESASASATPSVASARRSGTGTRHSYAVRRIPCATPRRPVGRDRGRGVKTGGDRSVPRASGVSGENPLTPSKASAIPTRSGSSGSPTDGRLRLSQRSCDRAGFVTGQQIPTSWLPDYSLRPSKSARTGRRPYWQAAFESSSRSSYGGEVRRSPDAWSG